MSPLFIVVEGPDGVGKSTISRLLAQRLSDEAGTGVHLTCEPSNTALGRLLRSSEAGLRGRALALACAADRYAHIDNEIIPQLDANNHVVSDRYVQSSLVLQRIDGLSLDEIWMYNEHVLTPTVSFYLEEQPAVIRQRLEARGKSSRLEAISSPEQDLSFYDDAYQFLRRSDWQQHKVDCRGLDEHAVTEYILGHVRQHE